jgi:hypothetical protein
MNDDPLPDHSGTTFANTEGAVSYYVTPMKETLSSDITDSVDSGYHQAIVHFLQKPYLLKDGTITTATTVGNITRVDLFKDIETIPIYLEKLKGFLGFKATTVIRLQINATRFMQGRLFMHFVPQAMANLNNTLGVRNLNRTTKTQHPRVDLDIGTQSEAVFEVPYVSPANCLNLQTGYGNCGSVYLDLYSPLLVGTGQPNSFDYSIWISFKDIEISTPSTPNLVFGTQMNEAKDFGNNLGKRIRKAIPPGSLKAKLVADAENRKSAWLSTTLSNMADLSSSIASLSLPIAPTLSALAGPTAWALSAASGLTSAFGWSKKTILNEPTIVKFGSAPYMNNSDGAETSTVLANQSTNEVRVLPGFANTSMDEMALKNLVTRPAFYKEFTFSVGQSEDEILFVDLVKPGYYYHLGLDDTMSVSGTTVTYRTYLPISYFSRFFEKYRGSVKYTLKFVKTEFHSGRVLLSYTPGNSLAAPDNVDSTYVFRDIIDLRHSSEFSFVCPYVATQPYRPVVNTLADVGALASMGYFQIRVLNSLQAPNTVAQSISCIVEVSACDDFELANPVPFVANEDPDYQTNIFRTQMDSSNELVGALAKPVGSSSIVGANNLAPSEFCIGEIVTSVKQLLTRFSRVLAPSATASLNNRFINPYFIGFMGFDGSFTLVTNNMNSDYFSFIGACFAYCRGSVRIGTAITNTTAMPRAVYTFLGTSVSNIIYDGGAYVINQRRAQALHVLHNSDQNNNFCETKIPMYAYTPFMSNTLGGPSSTPNDPYINKHYLNVAIPGTPVTTDFYRATGDDFQFGFFLNCPPIVVSVV